jgi:hypothetical protein
MHDEEVIRNYIRNQEEEEEEEDHRPVPLAVTATSMTFSTWGRVSDQAPSKLNVTGPRSARIYTLVCVTTLICMYNTLHVQ